MIHLNRLMGLLLLGLVTVGCAPDPPKNIVLISLDTVRRDHLSTYGYERATSPRLDSLANTGVLFNQAFTQATNTAPSHASMFTGLYPQSHGVVRNGYPMGSDGPMTLAEILMGQGFRTGAFISGYTLESEISGLDRGFEIYNDDFDENKRIGSQTLDLALDWLDEIGPKERFFLFLHLFDTHGPYEPSEDYAATFQSDGPGQKLHRIARYQRLHDEDGEPISTLNPYIDRYDALIKYQDDLIERLLATIDLSNTVVIVTSDHGETLGERYHSMDHGGRVFDEQVRIPLIVAAPGLEPSTINGAVETIDLLPTILDLLNVPRPDGFQIEGRTLLPVVESDDFGREFVYSTAQAMRWRYGDRGYLIDTDHQIKAVRTDRWKLIRYPGQDENYLELYDLEKDPGELENVADLHPETRDELLHKLKGWEQGWETGVEPSRELDPEVAKRLRALGYLDD
jgi:arylsulfatase A-like enzyme